MKQDLLAELVPRLKELKHGRYGRRYRSRGRQRETSTHQLIGDLLDALNISYKEDVRVPGSPLKADFQVGRTWVFVDRRIGKADLKRLGGKVKDSVVIRRELLRSDRFDHGIRVLGLEETGDLQTIFIDDPSFNFDYAHILPQTQKCSVMHGHTSSALIEVVGKPVDGKVVDFGAAKEIVREAVRSMDHKLFIDEKYVTKMDGRSVTLRFRTIHGEFAIQAPKATTVLLSGEATIENLVRELLGRITPKMPDNVTAVGVYAYEGLNKGSHLLAQIHNTGVGRPRRKQ